MSKLISLAEYAAIHGVDPASVRQKILRGKLSAALKIGRNWCIPDDTPYEDHRVITGKYIGSKRRKNKEKSED